MTSVEDVSLIVLPALHAAKAIELTPAKYLEWIAVQTNWQQFQQKISDELVPGLVIDNVPFNDMSMPRLQVHIADLLEGQAKQDFISMVSTAVAAMKLKQLE